MQKNVIFFLGLCLFALSSCNMVEEMDLKKDGSGHYILKVDGSSMFTDPLLKGMMQGLMEEQGGMDMGGEALEMDTVFYFADLTEEEKAKVDRPEFWEEVVMNVKISESKEKMLMSMEFDFAEVSDISYFYKTLEEMGDEGGTMGGGMLGITGMFPSGGKLFELGKKKLTRLPLPKAESMLKGEEMDMAKMFFSSGSYKMIYHLPGKVKKSTIPGADIDGKTVTVEVPMGEVMEGKAAMDGMIKYK